MPESDENLIKRIMPHDDETERSLLGAVLMDQEEIPVACEYITEADFYNKLYGAAFAACVELYNNSHAVDPVTLHKKLASMDVPPEAATMEFISLLVNSVTVSKNARSYAKDIADMSTMRRLIRAMEEIAGECYTGHDSLQNILEKTEKKVFELVQTRNSSEFTPIKDVVAKAMEQIETAARSKNGITGLATGFTDLDRLLSGLQNSDLILVAARPSMGKTAFVLNIAEHIAVRQDKRVLIFSLEMPDVALVKRIMAMNAKVDSTKIRDGVLNKSDWHSVIEAAGNVSVSNLIIDDTSGLNVTELRSRARKYKLEHGVDLIMIDYLQLMAGSNPGKGESRNTEISEISRSLKSLARELEVPVIALSQLSRGVESRGDHRPMLSDLRDSGAIEQDADVVMFLYRDEYYNKDSEDRGTAEVIVAKQRNGPIDTVKLKWIPELTKFANLEMKKRDQ